MNLLGKVLIAKKELEQLENRLKIEMISREAQYYEVDNRTNDQVMKGVVFACNDLIVKIMLESDP